MKKYPIISVLLLALICVTSCENKTDEADNNTQPPSPPLVDMGTPPQQADPPQNALGIWHYVCPKGCKGGAGKEQACAHCGGTLVHNSSYHNKLTTPTYDNSNNGMRPLTTDEPPQNTKGVWHYVCTKGCPDGAGIPGMCDKCGAEMRHNDLYHQ